MAKDKKIRLELVEVTREMLANNWPANITEQLELAAELDCNYNTLSLFMEGRTRSPNTALCQRIYEHYSGKYLISA